MFVTVGFGGGGRRSGGTGRGGAVALVLGAVDGAGTVDGTGVGASVPPAVGADAAAPSAPKPSRGADDGTRGLGRLSDGSGTNSATVSPRTANATPPTGNNQPARRPRPEPGTGDDTRGSGVPRGSAPPSGGGTKGLAGTTALTSGATALAASCCPRPSAAKSTSVESATPPASRSGGGRGEPGTLRASEASEKSSDTSARSVVGERGGAAALGAP